MCFYCRSLTFYRQMSASSYTLTCLHFSDVAIPKQKYTRYCCHVMSYPTNIMRYRNGVFMAAKQYNFRVNSYFVCWSGNTQQPQRVHFRLKISKKVISKAQIPNSITSKPKPNREYQSDVFLIETLYDIDSTNRGSASEIACRLHAQHGCTSTSTTDWNIIGSVIMIDKLNITNEWLSFTRIISTIMEKPSD